MRRSQLDWVVIKMEMEKKIEMSELEGVAEFLRAKREGGWAYSLSWIGLPLQLCGLNRISEFSIKFKFF